MTKRDLFLPVASPDSADRFIELAVEAEEQGYERVWLPETWGRDAVSLLATVADRTDRIGVGTSITNVYSRSPTLIGQTAATLQELSGGRFRLGLGPSGPILVEGWHGVAFERPLRRTRETIDICRKVFAGSDVTYDGDIYQLAGFRLRSPTPDPAPPIDAAGMSPKSVELAGRFADGWHALMLTPETIRERLDDLDRGAEFGTRDPDSLRVTVSLACCVDEDRERARELVREHLAFYVGAMGTFYREALATQGHRETAETVAQCWANGDRAEALAAIDDSLLDDIAIAGTATECQERLAKFETITGVDAVAISFPRSAGADVERRTARALAPNS